MMYNPFKALGIHATKDKDVIKHAFIHLKLNTITEIGLFELNVAYQDCLVYAGADGEMDLLDDFHFN